MIKFDFLSFFTIKNSYLYSYIENITNQISINISPSWNIFNYNESYIFLVNNKKLFF